MNSSACGTRYVKTSPRAMTRRPAKRSRVMAYAPSAPSVIDSAVAAIDTSALLRNQMPNLPPSSDT